MPTVAKSKYAHCKKAMLEPYRLCEVMDDKHRLHIAEYCSFFKTWFDEDGKPLFKIWLWHYLEQTCNVS